MFMCFHDFMTFSRFDDLFRIFGIYVDFVFRTFEKYLFFDFLYFSENLSFFAKNDAPWQCPGRSPADPRQIPGRSLADPQQISDHVVIN